MYTALSPEEIAERGQSLYRERIRDQVEHVHKGKALVLDIQSGDYEIDMDEDAACNRMEARRPDGVFYLMRIGFPASLFIGSLDFSC